MDNMYVVLERGVGAYVKGAKIALKGRVYSETEIDAIGKKIKTKIEIDIQIFCQAVIESK